MIGPAPDTTTSSRRVFAFFLVLLIHVVLIYFFGAGLSDIVKEKVLGNIQTVDIQAPKEDETKPPPPPPRVEVEPPPFVPPPDIVIQTEPEPNNTAIQVVTQQKPVEPPPPAKKVVVYPKLDARHGGISKPDYPRLERSAGHEGTVSVYACIEPDNKVGEVRVNKSSGFPALDEAAVEAVRSGRFISGTENGQAATICLTVPIVFRLTDR